jgi:hypothetical protein
MEVLLLVKVPQIDYTKLIPETDLSSVPGHNEVSSS